MGLEYDGQRQAIPAVQAFHPSPAFLKVQEVQAVLERRAGQYMKILAHREDQVAPKIFYSLYGKGKPFFRGFLAVRQEPVDNSCNSLSLPGAGRIPHRHQVLQVLHWDHLLRLAHQNH